MNLTRPSRKRQAAGGGSDESILCENPEPVPSHRPQNDGDGSRTATDQTLISSLLEMKIDEKDVDAILADEIAQMSINERETLYEEIHGVHNPDERETPVFLRVRLEAMEKAIQAISFKPAYMLAEQINHGLYVHDNQFRVMFLRCEYYDPCKAAARLVRYLESMLELFGPDLLQRRLYLTDLSDSDLAFLKSGVIQLLPTRDRSGRAVFISFPGAVTPTCSEEVENLLKIQSYMVMSLLVDDEESQRKGVVQLMYLFGKFSSNFDHDLYRRAPKLMESLPVRYNALHFCSDDPVVRLLLPLLKVGLGRERRARLRTHFGSTTECQYSLMTFGIPIKSIPASYDGKKKAASHLKWVSRSWARELNVKNGAAAGIKLPVNADVLLGRGRPLQTHPGNQGLRSLVDHYREEYENTQYGGKVDIEKRIIASVSRNGGRFLKQDDSGSWMEVDVDAAIEKVSHLFRTARRLTVDNGIAVASLSSVLDTSNKRHRVKNEPSGAEG